MCRTKTKRRKYIWGYGSHRNWSSGTRQKAARCLGRRWTLPGDLIRKALEECGSKQGVVVYVINYELKDRLRGAFIVEAGLRL